MTKILSYDSKGNYDGLAGMTCDWESYCKKADISINGFIENMSKPTTLVNEVWLELNNIEPNHKFLKAEFEIIDG